MIKINKLTDYATVIMSYFALQPAKIMSATHIAREVHLALPTVSKILKILSEAKLLKSYRGSGGGYQLERASHDITVADVVSAIEGQFALTECCVTNNDCAIHSLCAIKDNWKRINTIIFHALEKITLHDMTRSLAGHALWLRGIPIKIEE